MGIIDKLSAALAENHREIDRLRAQLVTKDARIAELEAAGNRLGDTAIGAILDNMESVAMNREDRDDVNSPVIGYICRIDFECELGAACGGNTIYPDIEDCRAHRGCTEHCGMVEVEVRCRRVVHRGSDNE